MAPTYFLVARINYEETLKSFVAIVALCLPSMEDNAHSRYWHEWHVLGTASSAPFYEYAYHHLCATGMTKKRRKIVEAILFRYSWFLCWRSKALPAVFGRQKERLGYKETGQ